MSRLLIFAVPAALLAGCQASNLPEPQRPPIICSAGADCNEKWSRAVAWVTDNASYKVQTKTDHLIQTFNATQNGDPGLMATVDKISVAPRKYEIRGRFGCLNTLVCSPLSPSQALKKFTDYVNGAK